MPIDWRQFHARNMETPVVVDPRRRLRICLLGFLAALAIVYGREIQLEATYGAGYRAEALRPVEKKTWLPAPRGRILFRDGTPLACDQTFQAVAVHYRWLQDPPDPRWLRTQIRSRLAKKDRKNEEKVAAARADVMAEHADLANRLAALCGMTPEQWKDRVKKIQDRIERIADHANRRQKSETDRRPEEDGSWAVRIRRLLLDEPPQPHITVAEEVDFHVVSENVSQQVVSEIDDHPERYPGTKIVEVTRRVYPGGTLAAHVVGHLGIYSPLPQDGKRFGGRAVGDKTSPLPLGEGSGVRADGDDTISNDPTEKYLPDDLVGKMGVERQYESQLRGRRGTAIERKDRGGRVLSSFHSQEPIPGDDMTLTLDSRLQRTAEELLRSASRRQTLLGGDTSSGGAIVVMDVRDGAIRAAASWPTFDPNIFSRGDSYNSPLRAPTEGWSGEGPGVRAVSASNPITTLLSDPTHPLFDRVAQMALPPGSTFKIITAAALLESGAVDPRAAFFCQGYLNDPDQQRCEIFIRQHIGHNNVTLADALCVSCNVYFFHFAGLMGPRPIVDWAERFGFGRTTGVDLPGESAGTLPSPENIAELEGHRWRTIDTQSLAVGQGSLTATPLQVLRMAAAVANGGRLVTPHVATRDGGRGTGGGMLLLPRTLRVVREGLRRVVDDPQGTAHATVAVESIAIAGKTGTAETGEDQPAHAWFAGYVPADDPQLAFVVVLEHAGDAATTAGPLAKRLVVRMEQLGMF